MNVDPRNAADNSFEVQLPHHVGRQQDELSAQTIAPTSSEDQANLEQS